MNYGYSVGELKKWWPARCTASGCGWHGLSRDCAVGESTQQAGGCEDVLCPKCYAVVDDDTNHCQCHGENGQPLLTCSGCPR